MKKQFLFIVASIFTMLFAACSQENELDTLGGEKSNLVSVSTQLPADFAKTRALPGATNHKLRCILEVWSTGEPAAPIHRLEKIGESTADNITFTFALEKEGDYDCLMWADFIAADAVATNGKFTDKYYDTTDLKAIAVNDLKTLFNNDACDAFFAKEVLKKTAAAGTLGAKLTRPFAKLTLKEADATRFTTCENVAINYSAPSKFNVMDGSVSDSQTATHSAAPIKGEKNVYFTSYILAGDNDALGNINLTFTAKGSSELIEKIVPSGVPTKRNFRTNATGYLMGEKPAASPDASVEVKIDGAWTDPDIEDEEDGEDKPEAPKPVVGDFYYADGTYSATLTNNENNPCIGIVFAVGAGKDDVITNYAGTGLSEIKGYVVALTDAALTAESKPTSVFWCALKQDEVPLPTIEGTSNGTNFDGYTNSQKVIEAFTAAPREYLAVSSCASYSVKAPAETSGWYLPSNAQLLSIATNYYAIEKKEGSESEYVGTPKILHTKLELAGSIISPTNYWSSSYNNANVSTAEGRPISRMSFNTDITKTGYGSISSAELKKHNANVRAILTF